eukprot:g3543.t1
MRGGPRGSRGTLRLETLNMDISSDDCAFVIGKGGETKRKLMRVSGAKISIDLHTLKVAITGTKKQCERAKFYIDILSRQRQRKPLTLEGLEDERDDLTVVHVPTDTVGYVNGRGGTGLRQIEQEWGTLMYFAQEEKSTGYVRLAIFGEKRGRRGAQLKVFSSMEHKRPNCVLKDGKELREPLDINSSSRERSSSKDAWGTDTVLLAEEDFSYAIGGKGQTRRKLATASRCIIEYVGRLAVLCGTGNERLRARQYLHYLILQREDQHVEINDMYTRTDLTVVLVAQEALGFIKGPQGRALRQVEKDSGTFCFLQKERSSGKHRLLIFGHDPHQRNFAEKIVMAGIARSQYAHLMHEQIQRSGVLVDPRSLTLAIQIEVKIKVKIRFTTRAPTLSLPISLMVEIEVKIKIKVEIKIKVKIKIKIKSTIRQRSTAERRREIGYIVGKSGATKRRLKRFTGAHINVDNSGRVDLKGTRDSIELAKLCIDITLSQQSGRDMAEKHTRILEGRRDVSTMDVDTRCIGFLLGSKGATLRKLEKKNGVFLYVDNSHIYGGKKKLYIMGSEHARRRAMHACEAIISQKLHSEVDAPPVGTHKRGGGTSSRYAGGYNQRDKEERYRGRHTSSAKKNL